ncbi:hypothetical protein [Salinibaculum rarum]|uniref:hypothetical protein n=1 Tax=Salinibaculum rarum TaxID=3058903 RepID=UPI00265DE768|nr:hypothetical protein [Salinibaculum sp. KK48]
MGDRTVHTTGSPLTLTRLEPGWNRLAKEDRHSTVAHFVDGYERRSDNAELLVWSGIPVVYAVDPDGETHTDEESIRHADQNSDWELREGADIEGYDEQGPADEYRYLVVLKRGDEKSAVASELCTTHSDVAETVNLFLKTASERLTE